MKGIALPRGETEPHVIEKEKPIPADNEALVRTLAVGIDGSDRRIIAGEIGEPPDGEDHLVIGHEAVGIVEDPNGTELAEGDVVAPMVRRPVDGHSKYAERGELDMAPPGTFHERGILGAHGYMVEYFTSQPEYLVSVPESRAEYGFFVEPASIAEKALDQTYAARSGFDWQPSSALVLGNGNLGLTVLARLASEDAFDDIYCLGRRDRPDPTIDFIKGIGGTYVDSRETPLSEFAAQHEPADFIFEATGYPKHAIDVVKALGPNGVAALQGIPSSLEVEIDGGEFHSELVVSNKALLGIINSRKRHFQSAVEWLTETPEDVLDKLVTGIYEPQEIDQAIENDAAVIKTVVSFDQ
ncbi:glucose 1-dehydrogenase [Halostagnicola bangensis]